MSTPVNVREHRDTLLYVLRLAHVLYREQADRARPRWFGLLGNANQYHVYSTAIVSYGKLIEQLEDDACDGLCVTEIAAANVLLYHCIASKTGMGRCDERACTMADRADD